MTKVHTEAFVKNFSYTLSNREVEGDSENERKKTAAGMNITRALSCIPGVGLIYGISMLTLLAVAGKKNGGIKAVTKDPMGKAFIARTVLTMFLGPVVALLDIIGTIMKAHLMKQASRPPKGSQKV